MRQNEEKINFAQNN